MQKPIIIIGIGEMGSVFARAFLKLGHPVYPVSRTTDTHSLATAFDPELVLIATGENDLQGTLKSIPFSWLSKCALIQNELLPQDWLQHDIDPTVISVWFEKKPSMDYKVIIPSPIYGPHAELLSNALATLKIETVVIPSLEEMTFELVRKNIYILSSNICGLQVGGTVGELFNNHRKLFDSVVTDIIKIQQYLSNQTFAKEPLISSVNVAFEGDPEHKCMGRSAPARLQRVLEIAQQANIEVNALNILASQS